MLAELGVPDKPFKLTLPAPALLGERMWSPERSATAYPSYERFVEDVVPILRRELELLAAAPAEEAATVVQIDDPHLCLFVDQQVRDKYVDAEAAAGFAVATTNELVAGFSKSEFELAVHLCRRAGGRVRGEVAFDGNIVRILHHINALDVAHITLECTTPEQVEELTALAELRPDLHIGFGCVSVQPGHIDSVQTIIGRVERLIEMARITPDRITLNPDCGFSPGIGARIDHDEVFIKLRNQSQAAQLLRAKHG